MNNKDYVLDILRRAAKREAQVLQDTAADMSGTELYSEKAFIPSFAEAVKFKNMLDRPIGFVCQSTAGRVVRLLQNYDSAIYTAEPEELPSLWGFVWSTDPSKALPFIGLSTSPYNVGECCTENGVIYRSKIDNNVYSPSAYSTGWEEVVIDD